MTLANALAGLAAWPERWKRDRVEVGECGRSRRVHSNCYINSTANVIFVADAAAVALVR